MVKRNTIHVLKLTFFVLLYLIEWDGMEYNLKYNLFRGQVLASGAARVAYLHGAPSRQQMK